MIRRLSFLAALVFLFAVSAAPAQAANKVVVMPAGSSAGPYSPAIAVGDLVFTSGQIPMNPATKSMPEGIEAQTRQAIANVKAVLEAGGSSLDKAVKITIFLKDLNDYNTVNKIYSEYFPNGFPARTCVQVARIPLDALIEIEAVGVK